MHKFLVETLTQVPGGNAEQVLLLPGPLVGIAQEPLEDERLAMAQSIHGKVLQFQVLTQAGWKDVEPMRELEIEACEESQEVAGSWSSIQGEYVVPIEDLREYVEVRDGHWIPITPRRG